MKDLCSNCGSPVKIIHGGGFYFIKVCPRCEFREPIKMEKEVEKSKKAG